MLERETVLYSVSTCNLIFIIQSSNELTMKSICFFFHMHTVELSIYAKSDWPFVMATTLECGSFLLLRASMFVFFEGIMFLWML